MVLLSSLFYHLLSSGVSLYPTTFLVLNISLSRYIIVFFSKLQLSYNLLPLHSFNLFLISSTLCALHKKEALCDLNYILFEYPAQINRRINLFNYFLLSGTYSYFSSLLQSKSPFIIPSNIHFIYSASL